MQKEAMGVRAQKRTNSRIAPALSPGMWTKMPKTNGKYPKAREPRGNAGGGAGGGGGVADICMRHSRSAPKQNPSVLI
jgi:hypothetical protein